MLDRVNIMRVFDFEGVVEGLNELIDGLERKQIPKNTIMDSQEEAEEEVLILPEEEARQQQQQQKKKQEEGSSKGMVLINNLSQVLGLLLKDNYARGMWYATADEEMLTRDYRPSYHDVADSETEKNGTST